MWNLKKKPNSQKLSKLVVARGKGVREMGEGGQRVQTSSYKMNKFRGCNIQHGDHSYQCCIVYLKVAKRVSLKSSHHTHTNDVTEVKDVLTNLIMVIISQHIHTWNRPIAHFKCTQCSMLIMSQ